MRRAGSAGGFFSPHRDGPWVPRDDEASVFTVLVYLAATSPAAMPAQGATGEREGACVSVWMMGKDACGGGALFERATSMARFSVLMWC